MCGIAGFLAAPGMQATAAGLLARMTDSLSHRGPDQAGAWIDVETGIALGHRRLSILDLSSAGSQPMQSHSGRYVLTTNGEIYNHLEIRECLRRGGLEPAWRGHSDTETMLAAFDRWGVESALERLTGMFAFAVWDRQERELTLARDRMGEKPLYYGLQGRTLLFGSELKALRAHPAFGAVLDRDQIAIYLQRGYVPAPHSIYRGIGKLPPGCQLRLRSSVLTGEIPAPRAWWSLAEVAAIGRQRRFRGPDLEAVNQLEHVLSRAVAGQSVADVPLGAFLSGGIDSSTVVALMQKRASRPVRTFAIGFVEEKYNEAPHAAAVAQHLGTDHTELIVTPREAMAVIPRLPRIYDEPFGDSSSIPTFLVAQLARQQVTVSLSGDGGDELFAGYTRYARAHRLWRLLHGVPAIARRVMAGMAGRRYKRFVAARNAAELYDEVMLDPDAAGLVQAQKTTRGDASVGLDADVAPDSLLDAMMLADGLTYLPDDILQKVDRASMAVSLESRIPLLDHRVVEFAWTLPPGLKLRDGKGKWLLRQLLARHVPEALFDRPKKGFAVPVGDWIRGPMREWAEAQLDVMRLRDEGFLDVVRIRSIWEAHLRGSTRSGEGIWRMLMFQAWLAESRRS